MCSDTTDPCKTGLNLLSVDSRFAFFLQDTWNGAVPETSHSRIASEPLTASTGANAFLRVGGSKNEKKNCG